MKLSAAIVTALCLLTHGATSARIERSHRAIAEFKRLQPCPENGATKGPCKGYIVDHIIPLACNGPDHPDNMQWQTTADAKAKDKWERLKCQMPRGKDRASPSK